MVDVPSARAYGFRLELHEKPLQDVLRGGGVRRELRNAADTVRTGIEIHVRATAQPSAAENYIQAMFEEDAFSDEYGFDFSGPYELGDRPIVVIGVKGGRGPNPSAKPPLVTESETHALTSGLVRIGGEGEDIR